MRGDEGRPLPLPVRALGDEALPALRGAELRCPIWWSREEESGEGDDEPIGERGTDTHTHSL